MRHSPIKFHKYLPVTTTGFSLLEVIIAMAILAGGIAILGQVIRIGTQSASDSSNLTTAQVLCESTMSELIARVLPLESVQRTPFETNSDWLYSVIIRSTEEEYLFFVQVIVEENIDTEQRPLSFTIQRWVLDPDLELLEGETPESPFSEPDNV